MGSKSPDYGPLSRQANRYNAIGSDFLNKYMTDQVSPGQQAELNLLNERGNTAVRTAYANSGINAGSTMEAQDINNVGLGVETAKQQFLNQYLGAAGQFFQGASADLTSILSSETQIDAQSNSMFGMLTGGLFQDLGSVFGGSGSGSGGLFGGLFGGGGGATSDAAAAGSSGAAGYGVAGAADSGVAGQTIADAGSAAGSSGIFSSIASWIGDLFAFL